MNELDIFTAALELADSAARARFLDEACEGRPELRSRIEALLKNASEASRYLEPPPANVQATLIEPITERAGSRIGPYKLLEQIGEGGMGVVYLAQQSEPVKRRVALKLIKPGMDTQQVVARFEAERQALAMMNHPNIAKVLDAGATAAGRPYFVMELVKGAPITEFCDQQKLATRERLQLFITLCQAVQHAHQKGLIHRDIKPSNLLVEVHDVTPVPKVIDFGVAKAIGQQLTESTLYTGFNDMVGTPLYMSPEQAGQSSLDVDTRSDVYSLGVVLYELLTGTTPFEKKRLRAAAYDELRRIIRDEEPPRPSVRVTSLDADSQSTIAEKRTMDRHKFSQALRGELDWIVMKTLEKDRTRRYESVSALIADVQRYLADEPVEACPPSAGYRLRKFARKHRVPLSTAAVVAAALLIGTAVSAWQAVRATQAQAQANTKETQALAAAAAERTARQAESVQRQRAEASEQEANERLVEVERQRAAVTQNLYYSDLRLGLVDWNVGNVARLSGKLLSHVPQAGADDLRGWEWYYLLSLCHQDERTLMNQRHVSYVAWSPDGRSFVSASLDTTVKVYDATSGQVLRNWSVGNLCRGVCWSPDSRRVAWGTAGDNAVNLGEVESGELRQFPGHTSSVWATAWTPDGNYLASAGLDHTIRVWEAATGSCRQVIDGIPGNVDSLAWHPDGKMLTSASQPSQFSIWDGLSGELLQSVATPVNPMSVAWSSDGKQLAVGTASGLCLIYRTLDWSLASKWKAHSGYVNCLAWNREGNQFATAGADSLIKLWDPGSGNCIVTLRGHLDQVKSVAWEPNGHRLISGGNDGVVKVWPLPPAPHPRRLEGHPGGIQGLDWGEEPDTLRSVGAADGKIVLWNVVNGQSLAKMPVAVAGSGQIRSGSSLLAIITAAERQPEVLIHDARSGERIQTVTTGPAPVTFSALSPNGSRLALTSPWSLLVVIDVRQNEVCFRRDVHSNAPSWSPDGRLLAAAGFGEPSDGWDRQWAGWVYVFDLDKRECVMKVQHGTSGVKATSVTWSPDGQRLVSGNLNGLAEVWEVPTGRSLATAKLHTSTINALAWSPDGRRVASASADGTVRVWDPARGEELLKLDAPQSEVTQLLWSSDGRRLAAAAADGAIHVWDATAGYEYADSQPFYFEQMHNRLSQATRIWDAGGKDEARALYEQTLEESKTRIDSFPPWVGMEINNLAHTAKNRGEQQDAVTFYRLLARLNEDDGRAQNNLAWLLATCSDPKFRDVDLAVQLAGRAVELNPNDAANLNTLGAARYRAGDWKAAIDALQKSMELRNGGDSFDWFFVAMAHWQLDHKEARKWYDQGVEWMEKNTPQDEELRRFRAEAEGS